MAELVEGGRHTKIISASRVQHIECECGFKGYTHSGDCPNCHATDMLPDKHAASLQEHRAVVADPKKSPSEIAKSLNNYHASTGGAN